MNCPSCNALNPDDKKFCGECGAPLNPDPTSFKELVKSTAREEVRGSLKDYIKENRIAEFDITEKVTNRLLGWVKTLGLLIGILLTVAGYLGFANLNSIINSSKK